MVGKPASPARKDLLKDSGLPIVDRWDHARNPEHMWQTATVRARREAYWTCHSCGHPFLHRIDQMLPSTVCPDCEARDRAQRAADRARYTTMRVAEVPDLMAAWADDRDPATVVVGDHKLARFRCPQGHRASVTPRSYLGGGCPSCRGIETRRSWLEEPFPTDMALAVSHAAKRISPEIAAQWHPTRNGETAAETITRGSGRMFWWLDPNCGHEWQASPVQRDSGQRLRCPTCHTILDSLAYHYPDLAAEWAPSNPLTAWHVRPTAQTAFVPWWVCSEGHTWSAPLASRTAGAGCHECRESGKSASELAHHAAAVAIFGAASSGRAVRRECDGQARTWFVDIGATLPDGRELAIEYDGQYWHRDKADTDTRKSLDLLACGYLVARLREYPLPPLAISHDSYIELVVYGEAPDPDAAIAAVHRWATALGV